MDENSDGILTKEKLDTWLATIYAVPKKEPSYFIVSEKFAMTYLPTSRLDKELKRKKRNRIKRMVRQQVANARL